MGNWQIVVPWVTTNLITCPQIWSATFSAEWSTNGDGVPSVTTDTDYTWIGNWSAQTEFGIGTTYIYIYQTITVTASSYTLSARVRRNGGGTVSNSECRAWFNTAAVDWDSIVEERDGWHLCTYTATPTAGAREFGVRSLEDDLRIDGVQLENLAYRTDYCDGTRDGCRWAGTAHASTSFRLATTRSSGRPYDLGDDLSLYVEDFSGQGMAAVTVRQRPYATQRGASYTGSRANSSNSTLVLWVSGSTVANLHALRQDLVDAVKPDAGEGDQLFMVRYTGAAVHKERGHAYEGGAELAGWRGFTETIPLRLVAPDPAWLALGESSDVLDDQDSITSRLIIGREDDDWSAMGPPAAGGTYTAVYAIEPARTYSGQVYVGGNFLHFDNQANCDYIAAWDTAAQTWGPLGTGCAGGVVWALELAGDNLWTVGNFTSAGGVANTQYVAYYDISASTWISVGNADAAIQDVLYASDGKVWVVGNFANIGGVAATRIAYWDGSAWNAVGAGLDGVGWCLAEGIDGYIYVGGAFANAGGVACTRIAYYDGSAFNPLSTGCNNVVYELCIDDAGDLYASGLFTSAGGNTDCNHIGRWNGAEWFDLNQGATATNIHAMAWIDGQLYVGGQVMTAIGDLAPTSNRARWNGSTWSNIDFDIVASPHIVYEIAADEYGNVYYGHDASGTVYHAGDTTVTNNGTMAQRPMIWFTSAVDTEFQMIRNTRTGAEINFDMSEILTTDEIVTIDLRDPEAPSVRSDIRGNLLKNVLPGSVLTNLELLPGDNVIEAYGYNGTAGTTGTAIYIVWTDAFWGID